MGIALLKKLNNLLPDSIKYISSTFIRSRLIKNKVFLRQYNEIEEFENLSENEKKTIQIKKLKDVLKHAHSHTKYYHELFEGIGKTPDDICTFDDMKCIPLLTKELIKENYDEIIADDIDDSYEAETGGSSGKPIKVLLEKDSIYREKAFIYHFWSKYGYDYHKSRIATFRGVNFSGKISKYNPLYNEILLNPFILNKNNVLQYLRKIKSFHAEFIQGYPSAITYFCQLLKASKILIDINIKAVFLISETCSEEQRLIIEDVLHCKTIAFYGHTERAVFAEQNNAYERMYNFNYLYGYTEFMEHADGNIICTGFLNKKFPLIRYAIDDEAIEAKNGTYSIIGHHSGEFLLGFNGERITQTALNFHDETFDTIQGYQLYQEKVGKVTCRIVADGVVGSSSLENIKASLYKKTGNSIEWTVLQVEK